MESDCDTGESTYERSVWNETYTVAVCELLSSGGFYLGILPRETLAEHPLVFIPPTMRWLFGAFEERIEPPFFMKSELAPQMMNLKEGDHLCLFYEKDAAEQMPALIPFIREGLSKNERFVYIADDQTVDELSGRLCDGGINVAQESGRGRLKLWTRREWRQPGELDSTKKSLQIRELIKEASKAGFKGVRFAVEMTWILGPDFTPSQLEHWEATINTLFAPSFPGRIVCQYNRSRLSPEVIMAALRTHPLAVFGEHVYPNFFYQAPLILNDKLDKNGRPPVAVQVEWIIAQLKRARAAENERVALIQKRAALAEKLQAEIVQRKRLEHEVAFASEREQLKLGQELHDGLAQHLTGIAFQISAFHETLAQVSPTQAPQAEKLEVLIREGVEQARALAHGLYPVGLENRGLTAALKELAGKTQKVYGVHCVVKSNQRVFDDLRGTIPLQLFRIVQEAVLNASKHGQARHIVITLAQAGRNLSVTVKDDGVGFSAAKVGESAGIGLRIMKHRASLIDGKLNYRNDKSGGAVITCSIPYKQSLLCLPPEDSRRRTRLSRSNSVLSAS